MITPATGADHVVVARATITGLPIFFDSTNNLHRDIQYHPEQPARIEACIKALDKFKASSSNAGELDQLQLVDVAANPADQTPTTTTTAIHQPFSEQELAHARDMLIAAHSEEMITKLEQTCRNARQRRIDEGKPALGFIGYVDYDTFLTTETFDVSLRAAATWIRAVDLALQGAASYDENSGFGAAMALTRPPGHHATKDLSNGFCLFNFAAAAAMHAWYVDPTLRISILDWDVHYGQGVADILQRDARARYVSVHQTPAFPYLGEKRGLHGPHRNVMTLPIQAETTWDCGYKTTFRESALPFIRTTTASSATSSTNETSSWEPDLVIVCAGYDALDSDELASVSLNAKDYGLMTRELLQHIGWKKHRDKQQQHRRGPAVAFGLEGGYQLNEMAAGGNLPDAVVETVKGLLQYTPT